MKGIETNHKFTEDEYLHWTDTIFKTIERAKLIGKEIVAKQEGEGWELRS